MGHTIYGSMPRHSGDVPDLPCIWCGAPTDLRFVPAARPELGPQPLHILCTANLIRAYERLLSGRILSAGDTDGMRRLAAHARTG